MTATKLGSALQATGLRKSFGDTVVLDRIDLDIEQGTVFSLLGPNGAGKTTAVRIFSTLLPADGGDVRICGHDLARQPDQVRSVIGVTGQLSAVDDVLTGAENLVMMADLHHLPPPCRPASAGSLAPALHTPHPGPVGPPHRDPVRPRRNPRRRLVRSDQRPRLPLGPQPLQPQPLRVDRAARGATRGWTPGQARFSVRPRDPAGPSAH